MNRSALTRSAASNVENSCQVEDTMLTVLGDAKDVMVDGLEYKTEND